MANSPKHKAGFSLTEATVVLGIAGLVIGSIWTATGAAYNKFKSQKMTQQIGTIVQNMANLFPSGTRITPADTTFENAMIRSGVVPTDMVLQISGVPTIKSPYGARVELSSRVGAERDIIIQISFPYTERECISFVSSIANQNSQLIQAKVNGYFRLPDSECMPDEGFPPPCYGNGETALSRLTPISAITAACQGNSTLMLSTYSTITLK